MGENHQDKTGSKQTTTEGKSQQYRFSRNDEEEAQKELALIRKRLGKNEKGAFNTTRNRTESKWKILLDCLNLLAVLLIPLVVVGATIKFSMQQDKLAASQHTNDVNIAATRYANDLNIAHDQQQETTLKSYLDDMSDLLFNHNLGNSKPKDVVRQVAKERTLITLRRLEADRNKILLQFLQYAHLIGVKDAVIDLSKVDLSNDHLSGANLSGVNLSGAILSGADLSGATLSGADLNDATLLKADLSGADLNDATLLKADLSFAQLSGAKLSGANLIQVTLSNANLSCLNRDGNKVCTDLSGANLSGAQLFNADLSFAQLSGAQLCFANLRGATGITNKALEHQVKSLQGAIMPDGSTHPSGLLCTW